MTDLSKLPLTARDFKVYKIGDQPRMRDVRFAQRLGFADRLDRIRTIVVRHQARLERLDTLPRYEAKSTGGRPATGYLLTLRQAFFIAAKSEAENADDVLMELSVIGAARYTGEPIGPDATPILDKIAAPPAPPTIERDDNVLHVRHEDWRQGELFKRPTSVPPVRPRQHSGWSKEEDENEPYEYRYAPTGNQTWDEIHDGTRHRAIVTPQGASGLPLQICIRFAHLHRDYKPHCVFIPYGSSQANLVWDWGKTPRAVIDRVLDRLELNTADVRRMLDKFFD